LENSEEKVLFSVLVELYDSVPIVGNLLEAFHLCEVDQGQNVLFEAAATEPNTAVQKFITDT